MRSTKTTWVEEEQNRQAMKKEFRVKGNERTRKETRPDVNQGKQKPKYNGEQMII
jgi:hypothetical protein